MGSNPTALHDVELAITGRLASMSRQEAVAAIQADGARYVETPTVQTAVLVVGSDGPPLGKDGRPTKSLRRARELQKIGVDLEIIDEDEFLARLGDPDRQGETRRLYTIAQLSRILGVPTAAIRTWIRADLIQPIRVVKRLCYFEFGQVASARRLRELADSGVTPARIRKSLERIEGWIPGTAPALAQLEVIERGGPVLVRLEDGRLAETNGQLHLDFAGAAANAKYRALWFDPRLGNWKEAGVAGVTADATGKIALPEFPSGLKTTRTDWGLKLKRVDG